MAEEPFSPALPPSSGEPAVLELSVRVRRGKETPWDSTIQVPLLPSRDPRPMIEQWIALMEAALAFGKPDKEV